MTKLKPYQLEGVQQIYQFTGRAILGDEMGLGKTIQALYWVLKTPKRRPVVIVCPAGLRWTWQAEAAQHFNMRVEVLEGRKPGRGRALPGDIVVIGYDILDDWVDKLARNHPQTVIFDEVHYLKNKDAKRSKAAAKLVDSASSVLGLSGTPLTNRPYELWFVMRLIRPDVFPSKGKYAWKYCQPKWTPWGWTFNGAANLDQLHKILKRECLIRRLKKDVLKELPQKTRKVISLKLDSKGYKEYEYAENDFLNWLGEISPTKANKARKSEALTQVGYLLRLVAKHKVGLIIKWLNEFFEAHPGEKTMALTMHTFVIDALHKAFPGSVIINGKVTGKKRQQVVRTFQHNPQCQLLLGNWKAAGVGITLTAACHGVALDLPWTPGDLLQGEDRLHRIGQKRNVIIQYLIALDTIEEKLMKILLKKSAVLDAVLNGEESDVVSTEVFEELLEQFTNL